MSLFANTLRRGDSSQGASIGRGLGESGQGTLSPLPYEFEGTLATEESDAVSRWKSYLMRKAARS